MGPSLPQRFTESLCGAEIGPEVGSCGSAAYHDKRVITRDIFADPKWQAYLELAELSGMRSCWSEPVRDVTGNVIGTFAKYSPAAPLPSLEELDFIQQAAELTGIVVDRKRMEAELLKTRAVSV